MSRVVKSVGRAIGKVVSGVANAVKSVATSKIGKSIMAAAAIYFGGAALTGAMGSSGAAAAGGLSGLSGAAANISAAWSSLGTAGSALLGGNLSGAGSAIASGFTGTAAAGGSALAGATGGAAAGAAAPSASVIGGSGLPISAEAGAAMTKSLTAATTGGGFLSSLSPMGQYGLISSGAQLAGGLINGVGQQKALEEQRNYEAQLRARAAQNVGTSLWGNQSAPAGSGGAQPAGQYDPVAEAQAINARRRAEFEAQYPTGGLVSRGMAANGPVTNNNFPVYNPMYYRG